MTAAPMTRYWIRFDVIGPRLETLSDTGWRAREGNWREAIMRLIDRFSYHPGPCDDDEGQLISLLPGGLGLKRVCVRLTPPEGGAA